MHRVAQATIRALTNHIGARHRAPGRRARSRTHPDAAGASSLARARHTVDPERLAGGIEARRTVSSGICAVRASAWPDLRGRLPEVTVRDSYSTLGRRFPVAHLGVAGHIDISPCRGKTALRVAMIAWSIARPGS